METMKLNVIGIAPLLMHNNQTANPLNHYAKALKHLTSKKKKTDEDHMAIARMEWEAGLYLEQGKVCIPARCVEATFWGGAKKTKNGVAYKSGVMIEEDFVPLSYDGPVISANGDTKIPMASLDKFYPKFNHQALVKVGPKTVLRTRPVFHNWRFSVTLIYDQSVIDERTLLSLVEDAGRLVGFLDNRPRMGRFQVEKVSEKISL